MFIKRYTISLIWGIILTISFVWLIANAHKYLHTDLTLFIPTAHNNTQQQLLNLVRDGPTNRLILIAISGSTSSKRATISQQLVTQLKSSSLFNLITNGGNNIDSNKWQHLFTYRYLLSPQITSDHFSVTNLHAALQARLQELASPLSSLYSRILARDPTGEILAIEQIMRPVRQPHITDGVWSTIDSTQALLIVQTKASGFNLDAQEQAIAAINNAFATANIDQQCKIYLSGPGAYGVLSRHTIQQESTFLTIIASLLIIAIVYLGYRSFTLIFLSILPIISGLIIGSVIVMLGFGSIHGIALAFSITLLGMAIDYPIHAFSHQLPGESLRVTLQRIWPTLWLGALTTIIAFAAMLTTDFVGLSQLGVFTMTGLATSALVTRWVLPELENLGTSVIPRTGIQYFTISKFPLAQKWRLINDKYFQSIRMIQIAFMFIAIISSLWIWFNKDRIWEDDLATLSPIPQELIAQDNWLRRQLNAPEVGRLLLIHATSAEQVLQLTEQLKPMLEHLTIRGIISGAELVTNYIPSQKTQYARQAMLPDIRILREHLQQALHELPFRNEIFESFIQDIMTSRSLSPITPELTQGTLLGARISPLLQATTTGWLTIVPLIGVNNVAQLQQSFANQTNIQYIDLKQETAQLVAQFRDTTLIRVWFGLGLLIAVLLIYLRSWKQVLHVIMPVAIALLIDIALLLALGQKLTLFHLIALILVVGVSLDYSLFVNHINGESQDFYHTNHALIMCLATTVTAFGLLASSSLPVLYAIGTTVTIGVINSYIIALVFMNSERFKYETNY